MGRAVIARRWARRSRHGPALGLSVIRCEPKLRDVLSVEEAARLIEAAPGIKYKALATLTPKTRVVFLLHRVEELTYNEIAVRLDISINTVRISYGSRPVAS